MDDMDGTSGVKNGENGIYAQQEKARKARSEVSDDSDYHDSDSDHDDDDDGDDTAGDESLANPLNDDDEDMDGLPDNDDSQDTEGQQRAMLQRQNINLMRGIHMRHAAKERLLQDPGAGFFLIDGDSLILEAMETKTWKYGQQLHLFYVIEIYLHQLCQNGAATFEVVFFKDMEKIWYKDILARALRVALINHLKVNCNIKVHCEWKDSFSDEWFNYLETENPSFIFVHDGHNKIPSISTALRVLTYNCLAHNIDVAFTSDVDVQSSKLYAVFVKSITPHTSSSNKTYLQEAWTCLLEFLNDKSTDISKIQNVNETGSLKEKIFLESLKLYWDSLSDDDKGASSVSRIVNRWCRYFAVLSVCTLPERIHIACKDSDHTYKRQVTEGNKFFEFISYVLQSLNGVSSLSSYDDPESIADIFDLAVYLHVFEGESVSSFVGTNQVEARYLVLHELTKSLGINIEPENITIINESVEDLSNESEVEAPALIAIKSRLSDEYAAEAKRTLNIDGSYSEALDEDDDDICDEAYEWLSNESLKDDIDLQMQKSLSKVPYIRMRKLKEIQKYNDFMSMYGKSLEGSTEPTTITKNENKENNKKTEKIKQKQKPKKQGNKKNMRETIIEENNKKILDESKKRVATQWKSKRSEIEEIGGGALAIRKVTDFINKSESSKLGYEEPISFLMQLQYETWKKGFEEDDTNISDLADFVHTMHEILQNEDILSDSMKLKIIKYFRRIGFEDAASLVTQMLPENKKGEKIIKSGDKCSIDLPYNVFQMKHMGHLMKRQERADPDPRVTGFIPDTWQRDLLDVVDKNESAVIVAPTSSGKTFCSFYCMEKVLRESDTGIVVYVSPTKALVNQVQATIYTRYKKNMPAGMAVVGVFTRDYQHNALTSQILVTVPQCLEILLLAPNRQQWASKLRYVIFDEVHCIGGESGGEVWEHLITLVRCPFLALSATIGNPDFFHSWLRCVNKFKEQQYISQGGGKRGKDGADMKYSVKLVVHNERYSDINKSIYIPGNDEIVQTHPCMFLDAHFLCTKGFPAAFSLSPDEAYELWLAGKTALKDDPDELDKLEEWCPVKYFGEQLFITKERARSYEISLKKHVAEVMKDDVIRSQLLIAYFREKVLVSRNSDKGFQIPGISEVEFDMYKKFPTLIEKLREEDKLPVIVFMNNRTGIENLTRSLSKHVSNRIGDVKSKMSQVHSRQSEAGKIAKKTTKTRKNVDSEGEEVEDHMKEYLQGEVNKNKMRIQKKENACKFVMPNMLTSEERDKLIVRVKEKAMLEYGIGYHHSGCDIKHRRAVEILFRSQYAQVVAATATLALGIHMPCKTVVFVGDDHYVDALNYRQMSGRSGRRGFDNLGNVVFYGVPLPKIGKLIRADISKLEGQFPVNCTIVLRLLILVGNSTDCDDAHKKAMTVLSHPFIAHQSQSIQNQLSYYFLFVTDFLMRQKLIDERGAPQAFSGLVSHLHYHEPANFVFVNLLKKGIFHAICQPSKASEPVTYGVTCKKCNSTPLVGKKYTCATCFYDYTLCSKCFPSEPRSDPKLANHRVGRDEHTKKDFVESEANLKYTYPEDTLRLLVCILAHIFCKEEIPIIRLKAQNNVLALRRKPQFASKVILDPLPDNIQQALLEYNESVQSIFGSYLSVVGKSIPKDDRVMLPISKKSWKLSHGSISPRGDSTAVDPFVQLSGCSNADVKLHCLNTEQIRRILPKQIYMDLNFIPSLSIGSAKNAYALDFFKHGSRKALLMDNWVPLGNMYDSLNDFRLVLGKISTAMEQLSPADGDDHVIWAFKHLSDEYKRRFQAAYPRANVK